MEYYKLDNGIKLIHKKTNSPVSHCGLIINAGTRDEKTNEQGISHFIEHVLFKGTKKRNYRQILSRLDDVGGEIDAFTTKEDTTITTTFLTKYYKRAIELIYDITFNSVFSEKELEKEKLIIYDEINSYKDSPAELIFDEFEKIVFKNHPLGKDILGTKKSLKKFTRNNILDFISNNYNTNQMVLASVGNIKFDKLITIFDTYFKDIKPNLRKQKRTKFTGFSPENIVKNKKTYQSHCIMGGIAYSAFDKKRNALMLLLNILAGAGLNSRLNLLLREKNGLVYNIETNYNLYSDTGLWSIYFGSDKENVEKVISLIKKELNNLKNKELSSVALRKAKTQLIGQITIANENYNNQLYSIGKSYLLYDKVNTMKEIVDIIENITSKNLIEISNQIFNKKNISQLIYK
ncbi:MAG: insulinase family protein [Bacteroidetes bacterium]|nr:MAG: insulinase family protein [Bacteroidota bacterium]